MQVEDRLTSAETRQDNSSGYQWSWWIVALGIVVPLVLVATIVSIAFVTDPRAVQKAHALVVKGK